MKRPKEIECVALKRDLPEFRLKAGNIGVVVLVYEKDAIEVEFMDGEGDTVAILTLLDKDVHILTDAEIDVATHADSLPPGAEPRIGDATKARA